MSDMQGKDIRKKALELGFDAVGFAAADAVPADGRNLADYLKKGRHGTMDWMAKNADRRADPRTLWPDARTVICLAMNYAPAVDPLSLLNLPDRAAISVYARGRDYHTLMKKRLKQLARWIVETKGGEVKVFVDTAPVMEKPLAGRAGLGWQGKHTNLVSKQFGSWLFLGEVFTTLTLTPDKPEPDHCGSCTACIDACPTGALDVPYRIEPRRCVSYLTIEMKDTIADDLQARMGNRVYGCDDCLAACPWNKYASPTDKDDFKPRLELSAPRIADFLRLDDGAFREVFAGSPIKRTGRDRFVRNVLIAAGNSTDVALTPIVAMLLEDASSVVRDAAEWAVERRHKQ